jgi:hypothetical protein
MRKKLKWKRKFDRGSIKSRIMKTDRSLPKQVSFQTQKYTSNFPSLFEKLAKAGNFDELYSLVRSKKSSRFIGILDPDIKIRITHSRYGLDNKDIVNNGLPLVLRWYLYDEYNICAYIPNTSHIYPINGLDEQGNILFVTHDLTDAPLQYPPLTIRYTLKDLKYLFEKFNFITFFKADEIRYTKI